MPTENERKYVLNLECEPEIAKASRAKLNIFQGYLISTKGVTVRLRKSQNTKKKNVEYTLAVKTTVQKRNIEIENKISKRDFDDLWEVSLNRLVKTRYVIWCDGLKWDVDFLKDYRDATYFALAEVELPEAVNTPSFIPASVVNNLLYKVDIEDTTFNNKLLSDARYATKLLNSILKEKSC